MHCHPSPCSQQRASWSVDEVDASLTMGVMMSRSLNKLLMMPMSWKKMTNYLVTFHRHNMPKNDTKESAPNLVGGQSLPHLMLHPNKRMNVLSPRVYPMVVLMKVPIMITIGRVPAPTLMMNHLPHAVQVQA